MVHLTSRSFAVMEADTHQPLFLSFFLSGLTQIVDQQRQSMIVRLTVFFLFYTFKLAKTSDFALTDSQIITFVFIQKGA